MSSLAPGLSFAAVPARPISPMTAQPKVGPLKCQPIVARMSRLFDYTGLRPKMVYIIICAWILTLDVPTFAMRQLRHRLAARRPSIPVLHKQFSPTLWICFLIDRLLRLIERCQKIPDTRLKFFKID